MISVITPSYNQLEWLRLCASSVADQKGVPHEHIVQDAGTGIELENWARTMPDLSLYVEKDEGMYDAVNRGLKRAQGEILSYLNCDEQLLPGALECVAGFFDANQDVEIIFGDSILVDKSGHPLSYRRTVLPILSYVRHVQLNTPTCSTFFRRSLIDRGLLFNPKWKVIGDQAWIESLLRHGIRMATIRAPLAVFTFTGENLSSKPVSKAEAMRRQNGDSSVTRLRKAAYVVRHRLRKLAAGAYRSRDIDIQLYTLESPSFRQRRHAKHVGFGWPKTFGKTN
jgi:glycosyltransferase involved in cell wall biosynthesis